jgi:hypothetical protein
MRTITSEEAAKIAPLKDDPEMCDFGGSSPFRIADHSEDIARVLEKFDEQLERFGLEVINVDFDGDTFIWGVGKRTPTMCYTINRRATESDALTGDQLQMLMHIEENQFQTKSDLFRKVCPKGMVGDSELFSDALSDLVIKGILKWVEVKLL